jgi:hypothetical protein
MKTNLGKIIRLLLWLIALTIQAVLPSFSQITPRVTVSGRVVDDSTHLPIQNANVFVANSTLGSGTNDQGHFQIRNVPVGPCELVASRVGYSMRSLRLTVSESRKTEVTIGLHPTNVEMGEVVVSAPDPGEWRSGLEKFKKLFIGTTANAQECVILNPEILDFRIDAAGGFNASVRQPLQIENRALGYHLEYFLTEFRLDESPPSAFLFPGPVLTFEGKQKYSELKPATLDDSLRWKENRRKAFAGSPRHFLIALFNHELEQEGFIVRLLPALTPNVNDPRLQRPIQESEILFDGAKSHEKLLRFREFLEVEYVRESPEYGFNLLRSRRTGSQVSWIKLNYESGVTIDSRGVIKDWYPTRISGYWAWKRIADALPLDYDPDQQ